MTRAASLLLAVGAFTPPAAWFATQQAQGGVVYFDCAAGGPPIGPLLGFAGVAACLAGGWLGWRQRRATPSPSGQLVAQLALGLGAIFALANLATMIAAWMIPPCAR